MNMQLKRNSQAGEMRRNDDVWKISKIKFHGKTFIRKQMRSWNL